MSENTNDPGHGDSIAAWVAVITILVAFSLGTLFFWLDQPVLVFACAGLAIVGWGLGFLLKGMGYGVGGKKSEASK
jgi:hypothetical protein